MEELPNEACGILVEGVVQDYVVQLPNHSPDPTRSYLLDNDEVVMGLRELAEDLGYVPTPDQVIVWHTHPSGFIGPSDDDLASREPSLRYLVVTLPNGEAALF